MIKQFKEQKFPNDVKHMEVCHSIASGTLTCLPTGNVSAIQTVLKVQELVKRRQELADTGKSFWYGVK